MSLPKLAAVVIAIALLMVALVPAHKHHKRLTSIDPPALLGTQALTVPVYRYSILLVSITAAESRYYIGVIIIYLRPPINPRRRKGIDGESRLNSYSITLANNAGAKTENKKKVEDTSHRCRGIHLCPSHHGCGSSH